MRYYSIPADFKKETIDKYTELNDSYDHSRVSETYGNITVGNYFSSGRLIRQTPKIDMFDLKDYIAYSREKNINFNYTLNSTHLHNMEFSEKGVSELKGFLGQLYDAGVRALTVTLPSLIELVQASGYAFDIKASTLCQVTNANKALAYKKLGVAKIVADESLNKDFFQLKRIREAFGENVEIIVNQICDKNCMYRMFHYNMIAGDARGTADKISINYYEHRCVLQQLKSIDNLLKLCWVRPEDIKYYCDIGIHYFKLQGRHTFVQGGDPVKTVKCYFDESFDGNLMDLLSMFAKLTGFKVHVDNKKLEGYIKPFLEKENFCKNDCGVCRYCENFARKCIDHDEARDVIKLAREFYDEYDQYKKLVNSAGPDGGNAEKDKSKLLLSKNKQHDRGDFAF
jgi:collagenase-like PrtC family protease